MKRFPNFALGLGGYWTLLRRAQELFPLLIQTLCVWLMLVVAGPNAPAWFAPASILGFGLFANQLSKLLIAVLIKRFLLVY